MSTTTILMIFQDVLKKYPKKGETIAMNKKILIFLSAFLLALIAHDSFSSMALAGPVDKFAEALNKMRLLGGAIRDKWQADGGAADVPVYPLGSGMPCEASQETGSPCWAHDIQSESNAYGGRMMVDLGHPGEDLFIDMDGMPGDIRFRCRTQGRQTFCFMYNCVDRLPAGCKQIWRVEWKINPQDVDATKGKCVRTMDEAGIEALGGGWMSVHGLTKNQAAGKNDGNPA